MPISSPLTLTIGVAAPLSGLAADLGREMANAIRLAIDDANASAEVPGVHLEAVVSDDRGDVTTGLSLANAFAARKELIAVVGHYNSNVTLETAPIYHRAELALISPIVSNPRLTESGWTNVFRFTNRDDCTAAAIAAQLVERFGKRRAVVVETRTTYGSSMSEAFARAFAHAGGQVLRRHAVDEGEKDFRALVAQLPRDMDVVFYGGTFEGAPLLKALRSEDRMQLLATGDGCWDRLNFLLPAGAAATSGEGVLVLSACPEAGYVEGSQAFCERYAERFGPVGNYAVNSYDAARTLIAALALATSSSDAGLPERGAVVRALRSVKRQGIAYPQPVQWDKHGDNTAAVTALHVVQDGRFVQVAVVPK
jgi:branched-chain amino acid transport system substrate-binding protein